MKNFKGLRRTMSWPTGGNLHEGTKDIKVFSLRIVGVPVQFQTYICRREQNKYIGIIVSQNTIFMHNMYNISHNYMFRPIFRPSSGCSFSLASVVA
jgi:hypothetical protein